MNDAKHCCDCSHETKVVLGITLSLLLVGATIIGAMLMFNLRCQMFIDAGYTRAPLAGRPGTEWVKK